MKKQVFRFLSFMLLAGVLFTSTSCNQSGASEKEEKVSSKKKIGLLLVNHGSRSETWRNALLDLENKVRDSILGKGDVKIVRTAFMEYTEPSIATRLKELDKEGCTDIIIVPVFLTVSPHSFDDIPTIIGQKDNAESIEMQKIEKIERYKPKARTYITPLLDFAGILKENVLRRVKALSQKPENEGLVLMAYGDVTYRKEWAALLNDVGAFVEKNTAISTHSFGWCGHIAHYNPDSTTVAINQVLAKKDKAVVIPVLVAIDEMFQVKIIGDGIAKVKNSKDKVLYKPDAILPDPNVQNWVIRITDEYVNKIQTEKIN